MDVDSRPGMGDLRDQACHQPRVQPVQDMGEPVMDDRRHAGIADQDLAEIPAAGSPTKAARRSLMRRRARPADSDANVRVSSRRPGDEIGQQFVADEQGAAMNLFAEPLRGRILSVLPTK